MKKARNMLLAMHPEATTRLRTTILHMKGSVFNMQNTFPKLHQVIGIAYNSSQNATHGRKIISFDVLSGSFTT
jgi:hypothetical protein